MMKMIRLDAGVGRIGLDYTLIARLGKSVEPFVKN